MMKKFKKVKEIKSKIKIVKEVGVVERRTDERENIPEIENVEKVISPVTKSVSDVASQEIEQPVLERGTSLRDEQVAQRDAPSNFYESVQGVRQRSERMAYVSSGERQERFIRQVNKIDNLMTRRDILQSSGLNPSQRIDVGGSSAEYYELQKPEKKKERRGAWEG